MIDYFHALQLHFYFLTSLKLISYWERILVLVKFYVGLCSSLLWHSASDHRVSHDYDNTSLITINKLLHIRGFSRNHSAHDVLHVNTFSISPVL